MVVRPRGALGLFLALTATASLAVGCGSSQGDAHSGAGPGGHAAMEGGEAGEVGGLDIASPEGYATTLQLMHGHLLAGRELITKGMATEAQPHIAHPIDELYGDLEPELERRGAAPFLDQLIALKTRLRAAPEAPETGAALEAVETSIRQAMAVLPAQQRQDPAFVVGVIRELLATAAEEYDAAVADDRFVEVLEYQDSRGFLQAAEQLFQPIAPQLQRSNPEQAARFERNLAELRMAWPSILPPATPVLTPDQVTALARGV
ncbi:hypothetical protein [Cyanobium sp. NIES-981]|uniref:hypothetical protein n=1 Tax=Cyanobium sp. NIES-981 TaxID=1851505 RepID=UPI0007DE0C9F|nr:hypothetical protein [Cyanobium sp. NIES-981]SBO41815.1 conserved exported protein of unknown function [Cyanobium sp. NIES-981]